MKAHTVQKRRRLEMTTTGIYQIHTDMITVKQIPNKKLQSVCSEAC